MCEDVQCEGGRRLLLLRVHMAARALQETCGATWIVVAGNNDIRRWAGQHKLLADLQVVMRAYPEHLELHKQLGACLLHIVTHDLDNKVQAGALGLLQDLKALLERIDDVEIRVTALNIAAHICHHCRENKEIAKKCGLLDLAETLTDHERTTLSKSAKLACTHMKLYDCMPTLEEITIPRADIPKIAIPQASAPAILSGGRKDASWRKAIAQVTVVNSLKRLAPRKADAANGQQDEMLSPQESIPEEC